MIRILKSFILIFVVVALRLVILEKMSIAILSVHLNMVLYVIMALLYKRVRRRIGLKLWQDLGKI